MKKIYKLLFIIFLMFTFCIDVKADDPCSDENLKKLFEEKNITKENDKISIRENCYYQNGKNMSSYKGCTREDSSYKDAYKTSGEIKKIAWTTTNNEQVNIKVNGDIPLTKDYFVVGVKNSQVKGVYFAGCYQGYLKKNKVGNYEIVKEKDTSVSSQPVYYVKVLEPNSNGTCAISAKSKGDIFMPKGIKLDYYQMDDHGVMEATTFTTTGTPAVNGYGFQKYEFDGCPKYFNLGTSFPTWWSASLKNAYIFSDNSDIEYNISWVRKLFGGEESGSSQGTTETDVDEVNRVTQCYEKISTSTYSCDDYKVLADKIYIEQKKCNNNNSNFFRNVDEKVQTDMLKTIISSINKDASRIVNCQFSACKVSDGSLVNKVSQSSLPSCLNSCVSNLKISNTLQGNTYTNTCASCYKTFYNSLLTSNSITSEQKTCLDSKVDELDSQINKIQSNFQKIVDDDMSSSLESKTTATTSSTRSYAKFKPTDFEGGIFGSGGNCAQVLGSNGVKLIKGIIIAFRVLAVVVAIVNAMIIMIPAVVAKDADGLKKASLKCVKIAVVLAIIEIFPTIIKLVGIIFGFDVSCI